MPSRSSTQRVVELPDANATRLLGARIAKVCKAGTAVLLRGPLGAGKTTFVDGFTRALGAGGANSPSFVLARRYDAPDVAIWHLDLYRLDRDAVDDLDLSLYSEPQAITLVEWPERADVLWPPDRFEIELEFAEGARRASVSSRGSVADRLHAATHDCADPHAGHDVQGRFSG